MLHCDAPMSHTQQLQEMLRIHHNPDQDKTLTESEEEAEFIFGKSCQVEAFAQFGSEVGFFLLPVMCCS